MFLFLSHTPTILFMILAILHRMIVKQTVLSVPFAFFVHPGNACSSTQQSPFIIIWKQITTNSREWKSFHTQHYTLLNLIIQGQMCYSRFPAGRRDACFNCWRICVQGEGLSPITRWCEVKNHDLTLGK